MTGLALRRVSTAGSAPRHRGPALPAASTVRAYGVPLYPKWSRRLAFAAIASVYIAIGILLSFHYGIIVGDALSRTADARFVLQSRDPHLAAMGFVFSPQTTLMQLPLVAVMSFWPTLLAHAVPATIVSSLCMAGSVLQVSGILRDRGTGLGWTYGLGLLYAAHPMIILYGANGMSEGPFLLFCTAACRFLMRWMRSDDVHDLAVVAMALAAAYLVRYDALAAGGFVAVLVAGTTWWRTRGTGERRLWASATDATVVLIPLVSSFVLWALVSWLLSGEAFAQFSSVYGNSAILKSSGQSDLTSLQRGLFSIGETMALAPLLPVVAVVVSVAAWARRTPEVLPPFAIFGGILAFQAGSYTSGGTFGFLRYSIVAVPLTVVLVGLLRARRGVLVARRAGPAAKLIGLGSAPRKMLHATTLAAVLLLFPGMLVSWVAMGSTRMAPQEFAVPALVAGGHLAVGSARSAETVDQAQALARTFGTERQLATYLDSLDLPDGSVLLDTVYGFAVVVGSTDPKQFVIPSDYDFVRLLNDPNAGGVQYLLTVEPAGRGATDAVNRRYPSLFASGGTVGSLMFEARNEGPNQPTFRLFRVIGS
ncbi:MAG TPA: hypothetical protein VIM10_17780 [Actinopolymorphaceae bacterium]